jgi:hypothetical protein
MFEKANRFAHSAPTNWDSKTAKIEQNSTQLRILTFSQSLVSHKLAANEVTSKTKLNFMAIFETISWLYINLAR